MDNSKQSNELLKIVITGIAIIGITIVIIITLQKDAHLKNVCTGYTTGWVTYRYYSKNHYNVIVSYEINGKAYQSEIIESNEQYVVTVHYNPDNVEEVYYGDEPPSNIPYVLYIFLGLLIVNEIVLVRNRLKN